LKIGFIPRHGDTYLAKLIHNFKNDYPLIDLFITEDSIENLYDSLEILSLDIVFSIDFDLNKYQNLKCKFLKTHPLYAILYKNHPLANKDTISRTALKDEKFIFINNSEAPCGIDKIIKNCTDSGFFPSIAYKAHSIEAVLLMVEAEMGITILPKYPNYENNNLIYIKLNGANEILKSVVAWNTLFNNPALSIFLEYIDNNEIIR